MLNDAYECVSSNIEPILELADELSRRVISGYGTGKILSNEINALPLFKKIKRFNGLNTSAT